MPARTSARISCAAAPRRRPKCISAGGGRLVNDCHRWDGVTTQVPRLERPPSPLPWQPFRALTTPLTPISCRRGAGRHCGAGRNPALVVESRSCEMSVRGARGEAPLYPSVVSASSSRFIASTVRMSWYTDAKRM